MASREETKERSATGAGLGGQGGRRRRRRERERKRGCDRAGRVLERRCHRRQRPVHGPRCAFLVQARVCRRRHRRRGRRRRWGWPRARAGARAGATLRRQGKIGECLRGAACSTLPCVAGCVLDAHLTSQSLSGAQLLINLSVNVDFKTQIYHISLLHGLSAHRRSPRHGTPSGGKSDVCIPPETSPSGCSVYSTFSLLPPRAFPRTCVQQPFPSQTKR
ncbi:hypothetical protein L226DRAFT_69885 [Lentinus tigrinus ALCF2SS1-7]|uniref:uncharacterized protein n=1 Tax=Lentinus tigrinus ALCF2SS1-7 TaxID=1328758 RepID=UPI0011661D8A|nr:hypothetical protein L226DRAFT_69885 [Lentinus tigrinus ALCF2SS1-7]